jgi:hypothetical protein
MSRPAAPELTETGARVDRPGCSAAAREGRHNWNKPLADTLPVRVEDKEAGMRLILSTTLVLALGGGLALAQTSGGTSSGGAPSGGAPAGSTSPGATPAPAPPGGVPRSNTEIFPPSRNMQSPAPRATAPGAPQPGVSQPEASSGGSRPGGAASSTNPQDNRTGKNALNDEYTDCMKLWDAGTHMTKQEWSATCRRVQSRLNQVQSK